MNTIFKSLAGMVSVVAITGFASASFGQSPLEFTLGGGTGFDGSGSGIYFGQTGSVNIVESGASGIDINVGAAGSGCSFNCGNVGYQFEGFARDQVQVNTNSFGNESGVPVQVFSEGSSTGGVNFQFTPIPQ